MQHKSKMTVLKACSSACFSNLILMMLYTSGVQSEQVADVLKPT